MALMMNASLYTTTLITDKTTTTTTSSHANYMALTRITHSPHHHHLRQPASLMNITCMSPPPPSSTSTPPPAPTAPAASSNSILLQPASLTRTITKDPSIIRKDVEEEIIPSWTREGVEEERDVHAFWDYQSLFASQRNEVIEPIKLELVEGALPLDLHGSYYLTGPGVFSDDFGSSVHPLDGHGYLRRFHIHAGSVEYSARYVDTEARQEEYDEESDTWCFNYRGPFSMLRPGKRIGNVKVMKNTANTGVYKWAGRLMCMWEGGEPYELHPTSLETMGLISMTGEGEKHSPLLKEQNEQQIIHNKEFNLSLMKNLFTKDSIMQVVRGSMVSLASKLLWPILKGVFAMPKERMLAHCRVDAKRQRLVAITCYAEDMVLPTSTFTVYEFDSSLKLLQRKQFAMQEQQMVHDWGLTDNHYVLIANRLKLDHIGSIAAFAGVTPMISALSLDDSLPYAPMYLLPRFSKEGKMQRDWRVPIKLPEPLWLLHVANAYEEPTQEEGTTKLVMYASACTYEWFSLQHIFGYDWRQRRLNPSLMNDKQNSFTEKGELGAPHLVKISTIFKSFNNEGYIANVDRPRGWQKVCDFPSINLKVSGLKNKYTYVGASSGTRKSFQNFPFDTIVKIENSNEKAFPWWSGRRSFLGEPFFVPRYGTVQVANQPGFCEDDGYLIFIQYAVAEQICYLVILDAQRMGQNNALVAKLKIPKFLSFPIGFHGFWDENQGP